MLDQLLEDQISRMDSNEQAMLLYTLNAMHTYKSKGAKTRRWRDFERWLLGYRAERKQADQARA